MAAVRQVEGWRVRLAREAEQARKQLSGKPSKEARERWRKVKQKLEQVMRREDPEHAKEERRLAKRRAYQVTYRKRHPERVAEFGRRWRLKNPEGVRANQKAWRLKNIERVRASKRAWNKRNRARKQSHEQASVHRRQVRLMEQRLLESTGFLRRLFSQADGRRYAIDTFRALESAGPTSCKANHAAKLPFQADALIRAWDELSLRGSRQAAIGFCVVLTDKIGARKGRPTSEAYEALEAAGKLRQWPAQRFSARGTN